MVVNDSIVFMLSYPVTNLTTLDFLSMLLYAHLQWNFVNFSHLSETKFVESDVFLNNDNKLSFVKSLAFAVFSPCQGN